MQGIKDLSLEEAMKDIHHLTFRAMVNEAAARGFIKGLEEADFDMECLPDNFQKLLEGPNYEVPNDIWRKVNEWTCPEQAPVIYAVLKEIHLARALNGVKIGEGPLGIMRGREHLVMPIELAGRTHCIQMTKGLHPTLKRFGLDKGAVQDKVSGVAYPWVEKYFLKQRHELFIRENLESYDRMLRFIICVSDRVKDWPEELSLPFHNDLELCLDAVNQIGTHYF